LSQAIYVAAKLGIPDLLVDGARDGADLAAATNTNAESLSRVLRLLAANEVLEEIAAFDLVRAAEFAWARRAASIRTTVPE
jgi:hypothetical protein